jgi:hypothetical protein
MRIPELHIYPKPDSWKIRRCNVFRSQDETDPLKEVVPSLKKPSRHVSSE